MIMVLSTRIMVLLKNWLKVFGFILPKYENDKHDHSVFFLIQVIRKNAVCYFLDTLLHNRQT